MSQDRKVGPLKQLQGLIWKRGYDKGDIKGQWVVQSFNYLFKFTFDDSLLIQTDFAILI